MSNNSPNGTPVVVGVGSNAPERAELMKQIIEMLGNTLKAIQASDVYETLALSPEDASPFLNAVVAGLTNKSHEDFVAECKAWEKKLGRGDAAPGIIPVDLDVVIYNGKIVRPDDFERSYFNIGYRQLLAQGAFQY